VLAKYNLDGEIASRGLVFCRFMRNDSESNWNLQALGWGCGGKTVKDSDCLNVL
jgi:hypothetical protein